MPELPDVTVYIEAIEVRVRDATLSRVRLLHPFVLRSVDPPLADVVGRTVTGVRRLGKRIVLALGTWQGIFFCEFDGPRSRKVLVTLL